VSIKLDKLRLDGCTLDIEHYLRTDYEISAACEELPPVVEWVNSQLQQLVEQKFVKKHEIKQAEAKAYFALKSHLFAERGYHGRPTEEAVRHAVTLEPDVQKVVNEYAILCGWVLRLQNLQLSLQTKLDLVRSSEATRRKVFPDAPDKMEDDED